MLEILISTHLVPLGNYQKFIFFIGIESLILFPITKFGYIWILLLDEMINDYSFANQLIINEIIKIQEKS